MRVVCDPAKDKANVAKHGMSLTQAQRMEWDTLWAKPDTRRNYGEHRVIGYAYIDQRLHCVIYADRDDERRIISLRKANSREVRRYAEA